LPLVRVRKDGVDAEIESCERIQGTSKFVKDAPPFP